MSFFNLFGGKAKEQSFKEDRELNEEKELGAYSGMRVEVTTLEERLLFVAKLMNLREGKGELHQYSEANISKEQEALPVKIRGYSDHEKKAVYMDGTITSMPDHIWKVEELQVTKIENARVFYRLSTDLDATVTTLREAMADTDDQDDADLDASVMGDQPLFKDVKAAPVKVGENFQLDTQEPDMEANLADTIRFAAQQGLKQIEIKLSPENLGSLTVKLTQATDGTLQVVLHTANAKAANLLNQHLDNLNAALQGYSQNSEVRVEVQRGEDSQQAQQQQTNPDGHNHNQQQQQQHQEETHDGDFMQKLRLGLFGLDDTI